MEFPVSFPAELGMGPPNKIKQFVPDVQFYLENISIGIAFSLEKYPIKATSL